MRLEQQGQLELLVQIQHLAHLQQVAAVLELAGQRVQAVPIQADEPMDALWAEPQAFDGCSTKGQARPGDPQPIHIVRQQPKAQGAAT